MMYIDLNGTSNPPIHRTSDTSKTTFLIIIQHPRHDRGSIFRCLLSDYATVTSSSDIVDSRTRAARADMSFIKLLYT